MEEATRFGIMNVGDDGYVSAFEEKPKHPKSDLASMGIYIFNWKKLKKYLIEDEADPNSDKDFGKNIIPRCSPTGKSCGPTASRATGGTWAPSPACGTPIWTCSPPR
jgi:glucose-1-phosphate adenylyltransferase